MSVSNIRQLTRAPELEYEPAISPDGGEVAYTAGFGSNLHIFVRDLGGGRSIPLTADLSGSEWTPRWSPDGRNIVFNELVTGMAHMIPRFGGPTRTVVDGILWGVHGDRTVYSRVDSIFIRSLDGGSPTLVARAPPSVHSAAWSPNGSMIAFVRGNRDFIRPATLGNIAPSSIWIGDVEGNELVLVTDHPSLNVSPVWLTDERHLMFISM